MFYKQYTDLQYKLLNLEIWNMFRFGWYLIWENRVPLFFITISTAIPSNIIAYYIIQNELFPIHDGIRGVKDLENIYKFSAGFFGVIGILASHYVIRNFLVGNKNISILEALEYGLKKWWICIATGILYMLALIGGFLLFIIPGIIISVWFGFFLYTIVFEEKRFIDALGYSRSLVRGRWWMVVRKGLGFGILSWILFGLPVVLAGFIIGWYTGELQNSFILSTATDVFLDVLSIPSTYIAIGLFLAFQKTLTPEISKTKEAQKSLRTNL